MVVKITSIPAARQAASSRWPLGMTVWAMRSHR
jgi:hypothetical protein